MYLRRHKRREKKIVTSNTRYQVSINVFTFFKNEKREKKKKNEKETRLGCIQIFVLRILFCFGVVLGGT